MIDCESAPVQFMMPIRVSISGRMSVHSRHIGRMHATVRRMLMPMHRVTMMVSTRPIRFDAASTSGDSSATAMNCRPSIASAIDGDRSTSSLYLCARAAAGRESGA